MCGHCSSIDCAPTELERIVAIRFGEHPFRHGVDHRNAQILLRHYLAMSQAFPYLQSGSQGPLILDLIKQNRGVTPDIELTTVVGNFLAADETGVNYVLKRYGIEGLPKILDTDEYFHSNLLRADLRIVFGAELAPCFDEPTATYLRRLYEDLADRDPVRRCAAMVAFEAHAEAMIEALWDGLAELYGLDKDRLDYFRVHVGGDDPAEAYHVATTAAMIRRIVPDHRSQEFLDAFEQCYSLNFDWCRDLTRLLTTADNLAA